MNQFYITATPSQIFFDMVYFPCLYQNIEMKNKVNIEKDSFEIKADKEIHSTKMHCY